MSVRSFSPLIASIPHCSPHEEPCDSASSDRFLSIRNQCFSYLQEQKEISLTGKREISVRDVHTTIQEINSIQQLDKRIFIRYAICRLLAEQNVLDKIFEIIASAPKNELCVISGAYYYDIDPYVISQILANINSIPHLEDRVNKRAKACKIFTQNNLFASAFHLAEEASSAQEQRGTLHEIIQMILDTRPFPWDAILVGIHSIQDAAKRQVIQNIICEHLIQNGCLLNIVAQILNAATSQEERDATWHAIDPTLIQVATQSISPILNGIDSIQEAAPRQAMRISICEILMENDCLLNEVSQILNAAPSQEEREAAQHAISPTLIQIATQSLAFILTGIDSMQDEAPRQAMRSLICQILIKNGYLNRASQIWSAAPTEEERDDIWRVISPILIQMIQTDYLYRIMSEIQSIRCINRRQTIRAAVCKSLLENGCLLNLSIQILNGAPLRKERLFIWHAIAPTLVQIAQTESMDRIIAELDSIENLNRRQIVRNTLCQILLEMGFLLRKVLEILNAIPSTEEQNFTEDAIRRIVVRQALRSTDPIIAEINAIQDENERLTIQHLICQILTENGCLFDAMIRILDASCRQEEEQKLAWMLILNTIMDHIDRAKAIDVVILGINSIQTPEKRIEIRDWLCSTLLEKTDLAYLHLALEIFNASPKEDSGSTLNVLNQILFCLIRKDPGKAVEKINSIEDAAKRIKYRNLICQLLIEMDAVQSAIAFVISAPNQEEQISAQGTLSFSLSEIIMKEQSVRRIVDRADPIENPYFKDIYLHLIVGALVRLNQLPMARRIAALISNLDQQKVDEFLINRLQWQSLHRLSRELS